MLVPGNRCNSFGCEHRCDANFPNEMKSTDPKDIAKVFYTDEV